jgi:hypothetical protein
MGSESWPMERMGSESWPMERMGSESWPMEWRGSESWEEMEKRVVEALDVESPSSN